MSPADTALLARLSIQASTTPCTVAKADALRLIELAGLQDSVVWRDIDAGGDPVLVLPDAVRVMVERVRTGRWVGE